jgi:hypothetical protein
MPLVVPVGGCNGKIAKIYRNAALLIAVSVLLTWVVGMAIHGL